VSSNPAHDELLLNTTLCDKIGQWLAAGMRFTAFCCLFFRVW
jgi:hypothetical protein